MAKEKRFAVIQLPELKWLRSVELWGSRFRLFVAADTPARAWPKDLAELCSLNIIAQVTPEVFRHFKEHFDHLRIKLSFRTLFNLLPRRRKRLCCSIRQVRREGIEGVGYCQNSCSQRDLLATQASWVTSSVVSFMMAINNVSRLSQKWDSLHDLKTAKGMLSHDRDFITIKSSWLAQDSVWNRYFPNVMQKCRTSTTLIRSAESPIARAMAIVNAVTRLACPSVVPCFKSRAFSKDLKLMEEERS